MLQQLLPDGVTPIGSPIQSVSSTYILHGSCSDIYPLFLVLDRTDADGPLVESPSLVKVDGVYVLFFSSNCRSTGFYDTSYATADNILGPYTRAIAPLLQTGTPFAKLYAPGGLDIGHGGVNVVFNADVGMTDSTRQLYSGQVKISGTTVHFT